MNLVVWCSLLRHEWVWIDYISLPQKKVRENNPTLTQLFKGELHNMRDIQLAATKNVKILPLWGLQEYDHRGWCIAEQSIIGPSPMLDLLYAYKKIFGIHDALKTLRIHLSDMSDASVIETYFGLPGGYSPGGNYTLTDLNEPHSNGKIKSIQKKLKSIGYEIPKNSSLKIQFPDNMLSVLEVTPNGKRSLIGRVPHNKNRKRKKKHFKYKDKFKYAPTITDFFPSAHEKYSLYWVDEWSSVVKMSREIQSMVDCPIIANKKMKPYGSLYKNLSKGCRIYPTLKNENGDISMPVLSGFLKFFFWVKTESFVVIVRSLICVDM